MVLGADQIWDVNSWLIAILYMNKCLQCCLWCSSLHADHMCWFDTHATQPAELLVCNECHNNSIALWHAQCIIVPTATINIWHHKSSMFITMTSKANWADDLLSEQQPVDQLGLLL